MRARAVVGLGGPDTWILGHGDLVGRLWSASLCLDDPRVSEAHAMVSLREGELRLLALRRRFAVNGRPIAEVTLTAGLQVELAEGLVLTVLDVTVPDEVLAIEGDGLPRQTLLGVCSLFAGPRPALAPGYETAADAWLWTDGERWTLRLQGGVTRPLSAGDAWTIGGRAFRAVSVALRASSQEATRADGAIDGALRIESWYDSVHILRDAQPPVVIGGVPARILAELVQFGGPAPWDVVAREVWRDDMPPASLRRLWDVNLSRLRGRLRDARIRTDLVQADGTGNVRIVLHDADEVVDHG